MTDNELNRILRELPAVHELAEDVAGEVQNGTPAAIRKACRSVLEKARTETLESRIPPSPDKLKELAVIELRMITTSSMKNVINATGIILHTAIGRACMPDTAVKAVSRIAQGYSVLQWDFLGVSRKTALRWAEFFDSMGWTARNDNRRVCRGY